MANDLIGIVGDKPTYFWIGLAVALALVLLVWKLF
jgi:hypothetical protein